MKKILKLALWALLATLIALGGTNLLVCATTSADIVQPQQAQKADCILVLGCGLAPDGTPGRMLTKRLETALELYDMGVSDKLLMTGDHGRKSYDEVNAMKRYAVERGVPPENVFMDHAGFSTYESMVRAKQVFACESVVIVSQGYHLYRSVYDAKAQGMTAQGVAADMGYGGWKTLLRLHSREALARAKDVVFCAVRAPVTCLGDVIPISGSGALTDDAATAVWLEALDAP